jgi:hypothetical protein
LAAVKFEPRQGINSQQGQIQAVMREARAPSYLPNIFEIYREIWEFGKHHHDVYSMLALALPKPDQIK